ncbi:MAG: REP-associated tyrosine transposase [Cytophagaceae bacterium]
MSSKYKFRNQERLYFISLTVVYWLDIFIRNEYRDVILDSLRFCQQKKGLEIYAWCLMTSHMHLIIGTNKIPMEDIMRDFKSFTSNKLKNEIKNNAFESRKEWLIWMMERAGKANKHNGSFQFWQEGNHPIELYDNNIMQQKLDYLHNNPVEAGFVAFPEEYLYSSAIDYSGGKGLLDIMFIE